VEDTLHAVRQLHATGGGLVQMFEQAELLGPDSKPMYAHLLSVHPVVFSFCDGLHGVNRYRINSFAQQYCLGVEYADRQNTDLQYWHPGFSWAASAHTLTMLAEFNGGAPLIERTLGGGDRHMCMGVIGRGAATVPQALSDDYRAHIMRWCDAAQTLSLGLGYTPGVIR
jgi:hypothetical protein